MDWLQLLVTLLTAFGGAYFGAWLNKNRYYQEKWWDRKVEAYSQIIEDLYNSYLYAATYYEDYMGKPDTNIDRQNLFDEWKLATKSLAKSVQLGDFIISDRASKVLKSYHKDRSNAKRSDDSVDLAYDDAELTKKCLEEITRIAKQDLQVTKPKPFWRFPYFRGSQD